jgi:NAD(P)-dependent dehydrogenase (short-subunit alcohol dehydrogenase family)
MLKPPPMKIRFDERVAIVTGAGAGLGRAHAHGLAARGATVVVNDVSLEAAQKVVDEIIAAGGKAIGAAASVSDFDQVQAMVDETVQRFGRIDMLINNAGILRDKTFTKMDMAEFRLVVDVHLLGSAYCTKAVWDIMRAQNYGRIVMTTSASGLFGNFGQSNYGAAKAGVVGLMNVLALEGSKFNIRINSLAPTAATGMTESVLTPEALKILKPETVSPGLLYLVSEDSPSGVILGAGAGCFAIDRMVETQPIHLSGDALTAEGVAECFQHLTRIEGQMALTCAADQTARFVSLATREETEQD